MVIALTLMVGLPLLGGCALVLLDRGGRGLPHAAAWSFAVGISLLTLVASVIAAVQRAGVDRSWVPQLGVRLHLGIDGISEPLVILSAAVTLLAVAVSSRQRPARDAGVFYGMILVASGGALLAFVARDVILFFLAFEIVLVPMWVLIDRFGDETTDRRSAGWMFILYTAFGSLLMLAGLLVMSGAAGTSDLDTLVSHSARTLPFSMQMTAALLLTVGFAIKIPVVPLHSWLPRAHTSAPTAGSMLLAAVLLKLGTYGLIRFVVLALPQAWRDIAPVMAVLGVLGIVIAGLVCLVERDLKRLVAWSSIGHMGFVVLALAASTQIGLQAALYGNLAHGVISALLFAVVGAMKTRRGKVDVDEPAVGLRDRDPALGLAFVLGFAASLGLPGLAGFWGEILALIGAWRAPGRSHILFEILVVVAAFGAVLAGAYSIRAVRALWAGEVTPSLTRPGVPDGATPASVAGEHATKVEPVPDERVRGAEKWAIAILCVGVVGLGVLPSTIMHVPAGQLSALLAGLR